MLTREANERLTSVGPGTPMGNLLRRYWHPLATVAELDAEPVWRCASSARILSFTATLPGQMGLVAERCPHRGASLAYGIPEPSGLRCPTTAGCSARRAAAWSSRRSLPRAPSTTASASRPIRCRRWAALSGPTSDVGPRRCCRAMTCSSSEPRTPHRHLTHPLQLAAGDGELDGPGASGVSTRQIRQLRHGPEGQARGCAGASS